MRGYVFGYGLFYIAFIEQGQVFCLLFSGLYPSNFGQEAALPHLLVMTYLEERMKNDRPKIALVIGAGGVKCAAALGVYHVLQQNKLAVDLIVGCSGGSIYASFLALGLSAAEAEQVVSRLWTAEITQVKNKSGYLQALLPRNGRFKQTFALRDDRLILERLEAAFGTCQIEETAIPLLINATDFDSGQGKVFRNGSMVDAIRASIAIPSIFQPWPIDNTFYSDGILSNPLPIDVAAQEGADIIIAIGFSLPLPRRVNNSSRFNLHVNSIITNNLMQSKIALCENAFGVDLLVLKPAFEEKVRVFDTDKLPSIIAAGEQAIYQQLDWLEARLYPSGTWHRA